MVVVEMMAMPGALEVPSTIRSTRCRRGSEFLGSRRLEMFFIRLLSHSPG